MRGFAPRANGAVGAGLRGGNGGATPHPSAALTPSPARGEGEGPRLCGAVAMILHRAEGAQGGLPGTAYRAAKRPTPSPIPAQCVWVIVTIFENSPRLASRARMKT